MEKKITVLGVAGMTCGSCVAHVDTALREVEGVEKVDVRLREEAAVVTHDPTVSVEALLGAVREAGYDASLRS